MFAGFVFFWYVVAMQLPIKKKAMTRHAIPKKDEKKGTGCRRHSSPQDLETV